MTKHLSTDDPDTIRIARRDSTCSFYQPPPPTDIEKMRNNMIKEQKVFALIREILSKTVIISLSLTQWSACLTAFYVAVYVGFMWMLLLVAYGQRDPHAYYLTQHIRQSFSNGISDSMKHKDILNWAKSSLISNLFGQYSGIPSICIVYVVYLFKVKNCLFIIPIDLQVHLKKIEYMFL